MAIYGSLRAEKPDYLNSRMAAELKRRPQIPLLVQLSLAASRPRARTSRKSGMPTRPCTWSLNMMMMMLGKLLMRSSWADMTDMQRLKVLLMTYLSPPVLKPSLFEATPTPPPARQEMFPQALLMDMKSLSRTRNT